MLVNKDILTWLYDWLAAVLPTLLTNIDFNMDFLVILPR